MKNITNSNRRLIIVTGIAVALLALAAGGIILAKSLSNSDTTPIISEPAPDRLTDEQSQAKKQLQESANDLPSKDGATAPSDADSSSASVDFDVSRNSGNVVTSVKITGITSGICTLRIISGGITYSFEANVLYQPGFSTCEGFSINPAEAGGPGNWAMTLSVSDESQDTIQTTKDYRVQ